MNDSIKDQVYSDLLQSISAKSDFFCTQHDKFFVACEELINCINRGGKILIFGNGGSACDSMHFVGELVNRFRVTRRPLPAIALTADTPLITCIGNDFGFEFIFQKQVEALATEKDVVIGISTSGNSLNVIKGLEAAVEQAAYTIALVGGTGGKIVSENHAELILNVDSTTDTPRIQETHEWILHEFCEVIERSLFQ